MAAGFTLLQDGDAEGAAAFDPLNAEQVRLAVKLAGVKTRRCVSEEVKARLASLSKLRRSTAGTKLLAVETIAEARRYVWAPSGQIALGSTFAAKKHFKRDGAE